MQTNQERLRWFNDARFGMFIHWGLYSLPGRGEWVRYQEAFPADEYHALADRFNPGQFDAAQWAALARQAGMRYMVLTAKHHDGFCLFDSRHTDFTSVKTAARRDFVQEYVQACRAEGLGVGLYFSVKDWDFPAYFRGPEQDPKGWGELVRHFHNQTLELMGNYGKIDILWYDCADDANFRGGWGDRTADVWGSADLNAKVRALQPDILINSRSGLAEDFSTPENEVLNAVGRTDRMFETCMTMNNSFGYDHADRRWKSTETLIWQLIACACRGCNYLLNVGPDGQGRIPEESQKRLLEIGKWLAEHGQAVYGTERALPDWWDHTSSGRISTKGSTAWLFVNNLAARSEVIISSLANEVHSAILLPHDRELRVERQGRRVVIGGFEGAGAAVLPSVIRLELNGVPEAQCYY